MEYKLKLFTAISISFILMSSASDVNMCKDRYGRFVCCQDYQNISGTCKACIGSYGKGCSNPCTYGYYGHGCRERCDCTENQTCDKRIGCVEVKSTHFNTRNACYGIYSIPGINVCYNNITEVIECCEDFLNFTGICEPCIGSWGENCRKHCTAGFYGFGCRQQCNCSEEEKCDRRIGCMKETYSAICDNLIASNPTCCQDYKNISGECIELFNPCSYGFYGHGCRERCDCSQNQRCDRERGCIVPNTSYSTQDNSTRPFTSNSLQTIILIPCGVLIFIVLGIVYNLRRKLYKEPESNAKLGDTANTCLEQEEVEDIYSNVRESKMIENRDVSQSEKYRKLEGNRSLMTQMCKSSAWQNGEEWQESASCSSPLDDVYNGEHSSGHDQTYYKGHCSESDTYNHLQLKNMSTCTLPARACMNMNYYALMSSNNSMSMKNMNYEKESYRKDCEYIDQTYKEDGPMTRSGVNRSRLFRPYSSVKYNRKVEREDNVMN